MLHFMLDFPENEKDSRKLKKVQALVQHFSNLDIYVSKQNISIDKSFINYEEEKREEKLCSLYIQIWNQCLYSLSSHCPRFTSDPMKKVICENLGQVLNLVSEYIYIIYTIYIYIYIYVIHILCIHLIYIYM